MTSFYVRPFFQTMVFMKIIKIILEIVYIYFLNVCLEFCVMQDKQNKLKTTKLKDVYFNIIQCSVTSFYNINSFDVGNNFLGHWMQKVRGNIMQVVYLKSKFLVTVE